MNNTYKLVYTDIKGQPPQHLPITCTTCYRSFDRATKAAKLLHKQGRSVVIIEQSDKGVIATWELEAGQDKVVFDCDENLCAQLDKEGK